MSIAVGTIVKRRLRNAPVGYHFGVVIDHYCGIPIVLEKLKSGVVHSNYIHDFGRGQEVLVEAGPVNNPMLVQARANQALRSNNGWSLNANCEHFARQIAHGKNESFHLQMGVIVSVFIAVLAS